MTWTLSERARARVSASARWRGVGGLLAGMFGLAGFSLLAVAGPADALRPPDVAGSYDGRNYAPPLYAYGPQRGNDASASGWRRSGGWSVRTPARYRLAWEDSWRRGPPQDGHRYYWSGPRYGIWLDDPVRAWGWRRE